MFFIHYLYSQSEICTPFTGPEPGDFGNVEKYCESVIRRRKFQNIIRNPSNNPHRDPPWKYDKSRSRNEPAQFTCPGKSYQYLEIKTMFFQGIFDKIKNA